MAPRSPHRHLPGTGARPGGAPCSPSLSCAFRCLECSLRGVWALGGCGADHRLPPPPPGLSTLHQPKRDHRPITPCRSAKRALCVSILFATCAHVLGLNVISGTDAINQTGSPLEGYTCRVRTTRTIFNSRCSTTGRGEGEGRTTPPALTTAVSSFKKMHAALSTIHDRVAFCAWS